MTNHGDGARPDGRKGRLAEALRANLRRRKAQANSRRAGAADERHGLAAADAEAAEPVSAPGDGERNT